MMVEILLTRESHVPSLQFGKFHHQRWDGQDYNNKDSWRPDAFQKARSKRRMG